MFKRMKTRQNSGTSMYFNIVKIICLGNDNVL